MVNEVFHNSRSNIKSSSNKKNRAGNLPAPESTKKNMVDILPAPESILLNKMPHFFSMVKNMIKIKMNKISTKNLTLKDLHFNQQLVKFCRQ